MDDFPHNPSHIIHNPKLNKYIYLIMDIVKAARRGDLDEVKFIMNKKEKIPRSKYSDGLFAMYKAAEFGHLDIIQYFLALGYKLDNYIKFCAEKNQYLDILDLYTKNYRVFYNKIFDIKTILHSQKS